MRQLIYNALRTPDGRVLVSRSVHDYRSYTDKNGKTYMIDGGREYVHYSAHGDEELLTLYTDNEHSDIREVFTWGSFGINGDQPVEYSLLKNLTDEHIDAILDTQSSMPEYMRELFINEQLYRAINLIEVPND